MSETCLRNAEGAPWAEQGGGGPWAQRIDVRLVYAIGCVIYDAKKIIFSGFERNFFAADEC